MSPIRRSRGHRLGVFAVFFFTQIISSPEPFPSRGVCFTRKGYRRWLRCASAKLLNIGGELILFYRPRRIMIATTTAKMRITRKMKLMRFVHLAKYRVRLSLSSSVIALAAIWDEAYVQHIPNSSIERFAQWGSP